MPNLIHLPTHPTFKLGLQPATAPRLLHFNTLKATLGLDTSSPQPWDYSVGLPPSTGVMYNDTYGDCTAAAKYHRFQVVVYILTGQFLEGQALQDLALGFYAETTGFNASAPLNADGKNPTDQGGNMQDIAEYLMRVGMLRPDGTRDKFAAAFMVDPGNVQDLLYCGRECLGLDFGLTVTTNVMPEGQPPAKVWTPGGEPLGGHDTYGVAFLPNGNFKVISWGMEYELTPGFVGANVSEVVCYVSPDALKDGKTVLGLDQQGWLTALLNHYQQAA